MKIPETITVAGMNYTVEDKDPETPELNFGSLNGTQTKQTCEIFLNNELRPQPREQVFIHEMVHAICDTLDISNQDVQIDERFVESFSQILYQVIKQL